MMPLDLQIAVISASNSTCRCIAMFQFLHSTDSGLGQYRETRVGATLIQQNMKCNELYRRDPDQDLCLLLVEVCGTWAVFTG